MNRNEVNAEIKKLIQKLKYQEKKIDQQNEINDEAMQKLREISRPLMILEVIQAIDNAIETAKVLRFAYLNLYQLGSPEDFYIGRISTSQANDNLAINLNEYDECYNEILIAIKKAHDQFRADLQQIRVDDFLQKIIDEEP